MKIAGRASFVVCMAIAMLAVASSRAAGQGTWTPGTPMPGPRVGHSAAVLNGKIHVVGGLSPFDGCLNTHVVYDPATALWTSSAAMPTARQHAGAVVIDGLLYVVGGDTGCSSQGSVLEVYNPVTNLWTTRAPMPTPRGTFAAAAFNGQLYVVGGVSGGMVNVVEAYNPVTNSWTTKAPLPTVAWGMAIGEIGGALYVAGGTSNTDFLGVFSYNPSTNAWTDRQAPMPTPRIFAGSAVQDGMLYVAGGLIFDSSLSLAVERYDPATNSWSAVSPLPTPHDEYPAVSLDGELYALGGYDGAQFQATVDVLSGIPLTPSQIISNLIAAAAIDDFQQGVNLLQAVLNSINNGNTTAACGQLSAFINKVQAQSGKSLSVAEAQSLIGAASDARAALGCQ